MRFRRRSGFASDETGTVLVETLIAIPVLTIATFGILEFGNMLWQREQLQIGVRDAARYLSRCRQWTTGGAPNTCDRAVAERVAFYGDPRSGQGSQRVPGWDDSSELIVSPSSIFTAAPASPVMSDKLVIQGAVRYRGTPVFNAVLDVVPTISYTYEIRYQGW